MNKAQLIDAVADRLGGSRRDANEAVEAVIDTITRTVAGGDRVAITGFGVFEKVDRPARLARNPRTGERVKVKKTSVPRFRAGQGLKDVVSGSRKLPRLAATRPVASISRAAKAAATASPKASATSKMASTTGRQAARGTTAAKPGASAKAGAAAKPGPKASTAKTTAAAKTPKKTPVGGAAKKPAGKRSPKK